MFNIMQSMVSGRHQLCRPTSAKRQYLTIKFEARDFYLNPLIIGRGQKPKATTNKSPYKSRTSCLLSARGSLYIQSDLGTLLIIKAN